MQHQWVTGFSHVLLQCQPLSAYKGVKAQIFLVSTARLNFVASKRRQALLHCPSESRFLATVFVVILPHPLSPFLSNNTSSKTTFSTQGNHRQRKQKCEQELPHAYCQLGWTTLRKPLSHKDVFLPTPAFSLHVAYKMLMWLCAQCWCVSLCGFRTHVAEALITVSSEIYCKSILLLHSFCLHQVLNWE